MRLTDTLRRFPHSDKAMFTLLFILMVVWMIPGIFPLMSYEGDANSIADACEKWVSDRSTDLNTAGYGYFMQPLIFFSIIGLKLLIPFAGCVQIYCVITAACAIALLYLAVMFINKLSGLRQTTALVALWLMPESYALAMYPNSEAPVLLIVIGGLYLLLQKKYAIALLLLCVAPLVRFDVLLIYPTVLPIAYMSTGKNLRKSILITGLYAVAVVCVTWFGYELLNASIAETYQTYEYWSDNLITSNITWSAIKGCYSTLGMMLIFAGIILMMIRKQWVLLAVVILPIFSVHFFNRDFGNVCKHFSPCVFFAAICIGEFLKWLWTKRHNHRFLFYGCVGAIVLFACGFSYMQPASDKPLREFRNTLPQIGELKIKIRGVEWYTGIGAGPMQYTPDEFYLKSGNIFYPLAIHSIKRGTQRYRENVTQAFERLPHPLAVISATWETYSAINLWLTLNRHPDIVSLSHIPVKFEYLNDIHWIANGEMQPDATSSLSELCEYFDSIKHEYPGYVVAISQTNSPLYVHNSALAYLRDTGVLSELTPGLYLVN